MIPEHITARAVDAYNANIGFNYCSPLAMEAALEAVAADIWEQGYERGANSCEIDVTLHATGEINLNPYRASETN